MKIAERLNKIPPYLFMQLRQKINKARQEGIDVISLGVGDPIEGTTDVVIEELYLQAKKTENHQYPTDEEKGMLEFRKEVAHWYERKYGVVLDPAKEVIALIGSKEGCHHFCMARVNPNDTVLMTDPGYPAYKASIFLADGIPYTVPILESNNFLPELDKIPTEICKKATAFFLNYPNNPTGAVANENFFKDLVQFAKDYEIAICHDAAYSEILFDGAKRLSFLSIEGAKDVGIELNSLSKPYNMTGWRLGMAVGNADLISGISKVKENTDSGIFNPIQYAGIRALQMGEFNIQRMIKVYEKRRSLVVETLKEIGLDYTPQKGTFYLWIPVPKNETSLSFTTKIFEKCAVVVTSGSAYGKYGEGYIRISLTVKDDRLKEAMERIKKEIHY